MIMNHRTPKRAGKLFFGERLPTFQEGTLNVTRFRSTEHYKTAPLPLY
jgi:hypothetical protein